MTAVFDHLWLRGLFGDDEAAAIWAPHRQFAHMLAFEAAYTRALGAVGKAHPDAAEMVAKTIEGFKPDIADLRTGTAFDGVPIPALIDQLRRAAGNNGKIVHTGATSQDVIDTALSLALREFNLLVDRRISNITEALTQLIEQFGENALMGQTRMQAALPISVADRLRTWLDPLNDHQKRLRAIKPQVELLQLGGPVGNRTSMAPHGDAIAAHMASELKLANPSNCWHTKRDGLADYASIMSLITGSLGKMGQDVCLMAQHGVDEVALVSGGQSSAMPHKKNPILAELLVALARFNATQLSGMHHALVHEQERSGAAWMLEWMTLPQMAMVTARSLSAAHHLVETITSVGCLAAAQAAS
ncbi:MAG: 3-carboxy-cis,cis-muconate cycloisomerase [Pseudomonadota bacterium]